METSQTNILPSFREFEMLVTSQEEEETEERVRSVNRTATAVAQNIIDQRPLKPTPLSMGRAATYPQLFGAFLPDPDFSRQPDGLNEQLQIGDAYSFLLDRDIYKLKMIPRTQADQIYRNVEYFLATRCGSGLEVCYLNKFRGSNLKFFEELYKSTTWKNYQKTWERLFFYAFMTGDYSSAKWLSRTFSIDPLSIHLIFKFMSEIRTKASSLPFEVAQALFTTEMKGDIVKRIERLRSNFKQEFEGERIRPFELKSFLLEFLMNKNHEGIDLIVSDPSIFANKEKTLFHRHLLFFLCLLDFDSKRFEILKQVLEQCPQYLNDVIVFASLHSPLELLKKLAPLIQKPVSLSLWGNSESMKLCMKNPSLSMIQEMAAKIADSEIPVDWLTEESIQSVIEIRNHYFLELLFKKGLKPNQKNSKGELYFMLIQLSSKTDLTAGEQRLVDLFLQYNLHLTTEEESRIQAEQPALLDYIKLNEKKIKKSKLS